MDTEKALETKENKTIKFQMMLKPAEAAVLDEYRWSNRIRSRAEVIRILIDKGLEALKNEAKAA